MRFLHVIIHVIHTAASIPDIRPTYGRLCIQSVLSSITKLIQDITR